MNNPHLIPVIVTTEYKGVFFGFIDSSTKNETTLELTECRNVRYWHSTVNGFLGLASHGPSEKCTISRKSSLPVILHKVTSVSQVSLTAVEVWNKLP